MDKMFSVVSEVENYHKFVPYCKKSRVTQRRKGFLKVGHLNYHFIDLNSQLLFSVYLN